MYHVINQSDCRMVWKPADKIGVALHNYKALSPHQLTVHVGDLLYILEECEGQITESLLSVLLEITYHRVE